MTKYSLEEIHSILEEKVEYYNRRSFIEEDPISVPHLFTRKEDIEIAGFWTAMLSWGQRKTIINKAKELMSLMDNAPYDFIMNHKEKDLKRFSKFKHRTFQPDDTYYFLHFFKNFYQRNESLESAFTRGTDVSVKEMLVHFHQEFFSLPDHLTRTKKHVSTPARNSSCKRLNMFLRWMVRKDNNGVDFGFWENIRPSSLMIPLDIHVFKVSKFLGLLQRNSADWLAVEELTQSLRSFDPVDPVKYDFALFSMGVLEKT